MRGFAAESHLDVFYDRLIASELVARFGGKLGAKVVGVGSVGTRAAIFLFVLFVGRSGEDPLVLQAKEAQTSVLEPSIDLATVTKAGLAAYTS